MIMAAAAKAWCNVFKALWKRMETLYHNVLYALYKNGLSLSLYLTIMFDLVSFRMKF